jgi:hypothetical protein
VTKYIIQRDRTVITNYVETGNSISFDCFRLPLDSSPWRSFETAIGLQDTLTFQVDVTGINSVSVVTVNGTDTPFTIKTASGKTNLLVDVAVSFSAQTVILQLGLTAPVLPVQTNRVATATIPLVVTNTAISRDAPARPLVYALLNPPAGAQIDTNGVIQWTPTEDEAPSTYSVQTIVSDPSQPAVSATNSFLVNVKGLLVATANDQSRVYGLANPPLTGSLVGVLPGDRITASYTTTATVSSPVGTYPVVPVLDDPDGKLTNYRVMLHNGTLRVLAGRGTTGIKSQPDRSMQITCVAITNQLYVLDRKSVV